MRNIKDYVAFIKTEKPRSALFLRFHHHAQRLCRIRQAIDLVHEIRRGRISSDR